MEAAVGVVSLTWDVFDSAIRSKSAGFLVVTAVVASHGGHKFSNSYLLCSVQVH